MFTLQTHRGCFGAIWAHSSTTEHRWVTAPTGQTCAAFTVTLTPALAFLLNPPQLSLVLDQVFLPLERWKAVKVSRPCGSQRSPIRKKKGFFSFTAWWECTWTSVRLYFVPRRMVFQSVCLNTETTLYSMLSNTAITFHFLITLLHSAPTLNYSTDAQWVKGVPLALNFGHPCRRAGELWHSLVSWGHYSELSWTTDWNICCGQKAGSPPARMT